MSKYRPVKSKEFCLRGDEAFVPTIVRLLKAYGVTSYSHKGKWCLFVSGRENVQLVESYLRGNLPADFHQRVDPRYLGWIPGRY